MNTHTDKQKETTRKYSFIVMCFSSSNPTDGSVLCFVCVQVNKPKNGSVLTRTKKDIVTDRSKAAPLTFDDTPVTAPSISKPSVDRPQTPPEELSPEFPSQRFQPVCSSNDATRATSALGSTIISSPICDTRPSIPSESDRETSPSPPSRSSQRQRVKCRKSRRHRRRAENKSSANDTSSEDDDEHFVPTKRARRPSPSEQTTKEVSPEVDVFLAVPASAMSPAIKITRCKDISPLINDVIDEVIPLSNPTFGAAAAVTGVVSSVPSTIMEEDEQSALSPSKSGHEGAIATLTPTSDNSFITTRQQKSRKRRVLVDSDFMSPSPVALPPSSEDGEQNARLTTDQPADHRFSPSVSPISAPTESLSPPRQLENTSPDHPKSPSFNISPALSPRVARRRSLRSFTAPLASPKVDKKAPTKQQAKSAKTKKAKKPSANTSDVEQSGLQPSEELVEKENVKEQRAKPKRNASTSIAAPRPRRLSAKRASIALSKPSPAPPQESTISKPSPKHPPPQQGSDIQVSCVVSPSNDTYQSPLQANPSPAQTTDASRPTNRRLRTRRSTLDSLLPMDPPPPVSVQKSKRRAEEVRFAMQLCLWSIS